jgi:hypothetical protein
MKYELNDQLNYQKTRFCSKRSQNFYLLMTFEYRFVAQNPTTERLQNQYLVGATLRGCYDSLHVGNNLIQLLNHRKCT